MIVVMRQQCTVDQLDGVRHRLGELGLQDRVIRSNERTLLAVDDVGEAVDWSVIKQDPAVEMLVPTVGSQLVSPLAHTRPAQHIRLGSTDAVVGSSRVAVIAGPCSVEDECVLLKTAAAVKQSGAVGLRGGAFKPRTNPYSFRGLGERALKLLAKAKAETGLAIVTEVMSNEQVDVVAAYADVLQVGTRNMHNFSLLSAVGQSQKTVLLKRGWSATLDELLLAAEYIVTEGNPNVILCERGIRTFESHVRNTLPLATVPAVKQCSPLPIIVDPSQGTGVRSYVPAMCCAAIAAGADGLLIEVHPQPESAVTDADQTIGFQAFADLMQRLAGVAQAVGRTLSS